MWPVDIVGSDRDKRQLEATPICADHHFCCSFTCRIGVCGRENARLAQVRGSEFYMAVYFIGRDMDKPLYTMLPSLL